MRRKYWSCTRFADWLRGTPKPKAETGLGWYNWKHSAKEKSSFRYWLAEEGLDRIQDVIYYIPEKFYEVKYYINNRWVTKTHQLTAHPRDIKVGVWCDLGNRFLPCLFNELVEFVEVELAWWHIAWDEEARKKYEAPWYSTGFFRWRTWRSREAGIDCLKWQMSLKHDDEWTDKSSPEYGTPTHQAIRAKEIYDLYIWWTTVYRERKDPHDLSGWSQYCDERREKIKDKFKDIDGHDSLFIGPEVFPEDNNKSSEILKLCQKIEDEQKREDEEMMIRLIKIRDSLWT